MIFLYVFGNTLETISYDSWGMLFTFFLGGVEAEPPNVNRPTANLFHYLVHRDANSAPVACRVKPYLHSPVAEYSLVSERTEASTDSRVVGSSMRRWLEHLANVSAYRNATWSIRTLYVGT